MEPMNAVVRIARLRYVWSGTRPGGAQVWLHGDSMWTKRQFGCTPLPGGAFGRRGTLGTLRKRSKLLRYAETRPGAMDPGGRHPKRCVPAFVFDECESWRRYARPCDAS